MEDLLAVLATAALAGVGVLGVALARAGRQPAAPAVPIESVVREAVAARSSADQAVLAGAVDRLVRMNQEMLDGQRRLGAQELAGTRERIDVQVADVRTERPAPAAGCMRSGRRRTQVRALSGWRAGRQTGARRTTQSPAGAIIRPPRAVGRSMAEDVSKSRQLNRRRQLPASPALQLRRHPRRSCCHGLSLPLDVKFPL
jgi:hypothetical protein